MATVISFDKNLTQEEIDLLRSVIQPIDQMARISENVFATKIWSQADICFVCEGLGIEATTEIVKKTADKLGCLGDCQDEEWQSINNAVTDAYQDTLCELGWIRSDDDQYVRKISDDIYDVVEIRRIITDGKKEYIVCEGAVDVSEYYQNGIYDPCLDTILMMYYGDIATFESIYKGDERLQVIAEMVFETTDYQDSDRYQIVSEEDVSPTLSKFLLNVK